MTFGDKDMDIWYYLEASGLPKASLVKKIIRDQMDKESSSTPKIEEAEVKKTVVPEVEVTERVAEEKTQRKSTFGGLATKR